MYSGYKLYIGVLMHDSVMKKKTKKNGSRYVIDEIINEWLKDNGYTIRLYQKPCCFGKDNLVFVGMYLGVTNMIYRSDVENYSTFEEYHKSKMDQLLKIQDTFNELDKSIIEKELQDFSDEKVQYYCIANDCDACT
jgi:hypothetical protein